ncbi:MAG: hypothetical protein AB1427_08195 [Thermodesulfobacteriota bacterium]
MSKKNYRIKTACPQCGCSGLTVLSAAEMKKKYGNVPNIELECSECMLKYEKEVKAVCPEWAAECKIDH